MREDKKKSVIIVIAILIAGALVAEFSYGILSLLQDAGIEVQPEPEFSEKILTVKEFSVIIEKMVSELRCSILEALMIYADKNGVELETIGSLVKNSHTLKAKLAAEAEADLLLKPNSTRKLPI